MAITPRSSGSSMVDRFVARASAIGRATVSTLVSGVRYNQNITYNTGIQYNQTATNGSAATRTVATSQASARTVSQPTMKGR